MSSPVHCQLGVTQPVGESASQPAAMVDEGLQVGQLCGVTVTTEGEKGKCLGCEADGWIQRLGGGIGIL
jgi:hypothetical protein